jgi:hypothetical protein
MSYDGTQLLPGQSPPLEVITATDQRGVIIIATTLGLIFASISLLIRLYLQLEIRHQVGRDDVAVLLAMVSGRNARIKLLLTPKSCSILRRPALSSWKYLRASGTL